MKLNNKTRSVQEPVCNLLESEIDIATTEPVRFDMARAQTTRLHAEIFGPVAHEAGHANATCREIKDWTWTWILFVGWRVRIGMLV